MRISIFTGDLADVEADAICTSTNPRLSLMMGTGAAVRARGGYQILRACEEIVAREGLLPPGSAWPTTAGSLSCKAVIHCVASDAHHHSSENIVATCTRNALQQAARAACRRVAMPVFATGHAHVPFRKALEAMNREIREVSTSVEEVILVLPDDENLPLARQVLGRNVPVVRGDSEESSSWGEENPFG